MKNSTKYFLGTVIGVLGLASCGHQPDGWTIEGTIAGANDSTLFIEEPSGAAWLVIDSLKLNNEGAFSYTANYPLNGNQAIYRLRVGDRAAYFPVENAEKLTFTANLENMDATHKLSGSAAAEGFNAVDSIITEAVNRHGATTALKDEELIRSIGQVILNDTTCIVSYYAINRPVENSLLFTPDTKLKVKLIGAAATKYQTLRPGDKYGQQLVQLFNAIKKPTSGATMAATSVGRPVVAFVRNDEKGQSHDLDQLLDRDGVTVVNLICYSDALAASNTAALGELNEKYKDGKVEIIQIGFDPNEAFWRQNAATMPWLTLYSSPAESADFLMAYNANPLEGGPVTLIFKYGDLVDRVTDPTALQKAVAASL